MRRCLAILVASLWLTGCGFHLVGSQPLPHPIAAIHVTYSQPERVGAPPLVMTLKNRLRAQHALGNGNAHVLLHLHALRQTRKIVSVSPQDDRVAQYQLEVSVQFDLRANGKAVLTDQTQSIRRSYSFDDTRRLASEAQENDLLAAMQKTLADIILLRVHSVLRAQQDKAGHDG